MSLPDLPALTTQVNAVAQACASGTCAVSQAEVASLLAAASRVYAACSADPYGAEALSALDLPATEACTVAAAMLRSQSLTPFEFSIWFTAGLTGEGSGYGH